MNNLLKQQKLNMWQQKLEALEKEYVLILQKKGDAASMGDLRENAAYLALEEDVATYRARIDEMKRIIDNLKQGDK